MIDSELSRTPSVHGTVWYPIDLPPGVGRAPPAGVLGAAWKRAGVTRRAGETPRRLEELNAMGVRLSGERDTKLLLVLILTKPGTIPRSAAGSISLVESSSDGSRR